MTVYSNMINITESDVINNDNSCCNDIDNETCRNIRTDGGINSGEIT